MNLVECHFTQSIHQRIQPSLPREPPVVLQLCAARLWCFSHAWVQKRRSCVDRRWGESQKSTHNTILIYTSQYILGLQTDFWFTSLNVRCLHYPLNPVFRKSKTNFLQLKYLNFLISHSCSSRDHYGSMIPAKIEQSILPYFILILCVCWTYMIPTNNPLCVWDAKCSYWLNKISLRSRQSLIHYWLGL